MLRAPALEKPADRKAEYARAFELFVAAGPSANLTSIAAQVGMRPENIITCARNQDWPKRRAILLSEMDTTAADDRLRSQLAVDRQLVGATVKAVEKWTGSLLEIIDRVQALPVEPDASEVSSGEELIDKRSKLLARKLDLLKATVEGFREMTTTTLNLGLLRARKGEPADESGKLDLSKLTTLNLAITQAVQLVEPNVTRGA